jgi:hypothetical protein
VDNMLLEEVLIFTATVSGLLGTLLFRDSVQLKTLEQTLEQTKTVLVVETFLQTFAHRYFTSTFTHFQFHFHLPAGAL